jgi:hypothetical protein
MSVHGIDPGPKLVPKLGRVLEFIADHGIEFEVNCTLLVDTVKELRVREFNEADVVGSR